MRLKPNGPGGYKPEGPHDGSMDRTARFALFAAGAVVLAALLIIALVSVVPPSRRLTIEEMRAGVDFELGSVRIQQTYFHDRSQMDAGTRVAFLVHFSDGESENVSFRYQTYICHDVTATTTHRDPQVAFHADCRESSVLVLVL